MGRSDFSDGGEKTLMAVAAALVLSGVVHVTAMYVLSDRCISTFSDRARATARRHAAERVPMRVTEAPKPVAAETRKVAVEEKPRTMDLKPSDAPAASVTAEKVKVEELPAMPVPPPPKALPGERILEITAPTVPDEAAAIPRLEQVKVARMVNAPEPETGALRTPVRSVLAAETASGSTAGSLLSAPDVPVPPTVGGGRGGGKGGTGAGAETAALVASLAKPVADAKPAAVVKPPVVSPEMREKVDERAVEAAKNAVRDLRELQEGKAFSRHVGTSVASYADTAAGVRYFRLTLSSDAEQPLPIVSKDIVFLLDASGSISNDRLKPCRKAVKEALRALNTGDRFNLVAFRDKFQYAFPAWRYVEQGSLDAADEWLSKLVAHGRTDVFATLKSVMAVPRDPTRPLIALMVTDGEPTAGLRRNESIISSFAKLNGGIVSVYMYGVKDTANDYLLDMVSRSNRGNWVKHGGFRFTAAKEMPAFLETFRDPVLTDLAVRFSTSGGVEAYPKLVRNLYRGGPVEIYGKCPLSTKDLVFEVRGLHGAEALEDVFKLSFAGGAAMTDDVVSHWRTLRGYEDKLR